MIESDTQLPSHCMKSNCFFVWVVPGAPCMCMYAHIGGGRIVAVELGSRFVSSFVRLFVRSAARRQCNANAGFSGTRIDSAN